MLYLNTTNYDIRNIEGWDDLDIYTEAASQVMTDHDHYLKTDEDIIREIEWMRLRNSL